MEGKIELFHQTIAFSPFWMAVNLLLIAHFFISWYRSYKKTGWKIDFWNWTMFYSFFVYVLFMYPFNAAIFNKYSVGDDHIFMVNFVDKAFAISVIGYLSVWLGRVLYDQFRSRLFRLKAADTFEQIVETNISNRKGVLVLCMIALLFFLATLFIQIRHGFLLNPRNFFLQAHTLRPLYNFTLTILSFLFTIAALRVIQFKDKMSKLILLSLFIFSLFMGIRGLCISGLLTLLLYRSFSKAGDLNFVKMGVSCLLLVILGILIECIRHNVWHSFSSLNHFLTSIFYGSHFSDTRDFAWLLSFWDGEYLYGKTYLSGFLSFMPRFLSEYRQEWSWGVYAATQAGFDPLGHAGLRAGLFGEAFFNFGYLGVIFLGTLAGSALRYGDLKMREAIEKKQGIVKGFASTLRYFFVTSLFITAGFWYYYFFIIAHLLLYRFYKNRPAQAESILHGR